MADDRLDLLKEFMQTQFDQMHDKIDKVAESSSANTQKINEIVAFKNKAVGAWLAITGSVGFFAAHANQLFSAVMAVVTGGHR